jgi:hypothetical protein
VYPLTSRAHQCPTFAARERSSTDGGSSDGASCRYL